MKDRLIQLITESHCVDIWNHKTDDYKQPNPITELADYLLENGVIVTPCVAMVEQFIKDGKFNRQLAVHNGKYAVVYMDKSKWNCPLIDITEQHYNDEKANERIEVLKGGAE